MSEQYEHWTKNEETVDRFIRGQLSPEERSLLVSHLERCVDCRKTIAEEQRLAEYIREFGRRDLKKRLKARVQARKGQVPWPHVISAAAVVIVAVGVGLYSVWKERQSVTVPEHDVAAVQRQAETEKTAEQPDRELEQPAIRSEKKDEAAQGLGGAGAELKIASRKEHGRGGETAAPGLPPVAADQTLSSSKGQQEFWLQGQVVGANAAVEGPAGKGIAKAPQAALQRETEVHEGRKEKAAQRSDRQGHEIKVLQQPLSALPPGMQQQFAGTGEETIPTLLQTTPQGMLLTLYTDRFIANDQNFRTSVPALDSLIIEIDGLQIVYRIPSALQSAVKNKATEK